MKKRSFEWTNDVETGDAALDNHTRAFLHNANVFIDMMQSTYREEQLDSMLGFLTDYSRDYFSTQEAMMKEMKYPNLNNHIAEHRKFIHTVSKLYREKLNLKKNIDHNDEDYDPRGMDGIINDTYDFIMDWYDNHMMAADKRFLDFLKYEK